MKHLIDQKRPFARLSLPYAIRTPERKPNPVESDGIKTSTPPPQAPQPQPTPDSTPPADTVAMPRTMLEHMMVSTFTHYLISDVAVCPGRGMVELAAHVSPQCMEMLILLVCCYLDSATDPETDEPRDLADGWLGVLERLQQIKDERS